MTPKKKLELYFVSVLQRCFADFPQGDATGNRIPDALVRTPCGVAGIEVTSVFATGDSGGPPPQLHEGERTQIVRLAQSMAETEALPPVMADIFFHEKASVNKHERRDIARQLVQLVAANLPPLGEHICLEQRSHLTYVLPASVEAVSMRRHKLVETHLWQYADAGLVCTDFVPILQAAIDAKNDKIADYRKHCDHCSLLVVADWSGPSAFFELSPTMAGHTFRSLFDRTFFLEGGRERVTELKTLAQ